MSTQNQIPTVSLTIDETSRNQVVRHTLQPKPQVAANDLANRPRSQSYSHKINTNMIAEPIPEADTEDEETQANVGAGNGVRASFTKKPPSRTNSFAGVTARKISEVRGYDNKGFHSDNFQRGAVDSTRSSAVSLQVQREQYCCCTRWTRFERRLALSVGVLAGVIIALVITVGLLARHDEANREKFFWKP